MDTGLFEFINITGLKKVW